MKTAFSTQTVTVLFLTTLCQQQQRERAHLYFVDRAAN